VGLNNGDGINFCQHPLSLTANVRYIYGQSNVGLQGRLVYRVDGNITGARWIFMIFMSLDSVQCTWLSGQITACGLQDAIRQVVEEFERNSIVLNNSHCWLNLLAQLGLHTFIECYCHSVWIFLHV